MQLPNEHLWPDTNTKTHPSMGFGISVLTSKDGGNANKCMEHLWPDTNTKTHPSMGFGISVPDTKKPELIRAYEHFNPA